MPFYMTPYLMTMIYYICVLIADLRHMTIFLKMCRKSTKWLIHDEESLDSLRESICADEYQITDEYRVEGRPAQRNEKLGGTLCLIKIKCFSRFIDDIVFIFNDIFDNEFFNCSNIMLHIRPIWFIFICHW